MKCLPTNQPQYKILRLSVTAESTPAAAGPEDVDVALAPGGTEGAVAAAAYVRPRCPTQRGSSEDALAANVTSHSVAGSPRPALSPQEQLSSQPWLASTALEKDPKGSPWLSGRKLHVNI